MLFRRKLGDMVLQFHCFIPKLCLAFEMILEPDEAAYYFFFIMTFSVKY